MSDESKRKSVRDPSVKVKTAKGRKSASTRWLQRQLNDPYVREAARLGYRSRAAFKLHQIDEKIQLFKPGMIVVDLGAAPGGWSQIAVEKGAAQVLALDILPMDNLSGVTAIQMDFMEDFAVEALVSALQGPADLVMSDMSPNTTGHRQTDHLRIMGLAETAYDFAVNALKPGGTFLAKVFQGGAQGDLLLRVKKDFEKFKHIKPPASRKESPETYLIATGFKGLKD